MNGTISTTPDLRDRATGNAVGDRAVAEPVMPDSRGETNETVAPAGDAALLPVTSPINCHTESFRNVMATLDTLDLPAAPLSADCRTDGASADGDVPVAPGPDAKAGPGFIPREVSGQHAFRDNQVIESVPIRRLVSPRSGGDRFAAGADRESSAENRPVPSALQPRSERARPLAVPAAVTMVVDKPPIGASGAVPDGRVPHAGLAWPAAADGSDAGVRVAAGQAGTLPWGPQLLKALGEQIDVNVQRGVGHAVIRLEPQSMGTLQIAIRHEDGALQIRMVASHEDVVRQLQAVGDALRQDLAARQHGDVTVVVRQGQGFGHRERGARDGDAGASQGRKRPGAALSAVDAAHGDARFHLDGRATR
ncbi:flagellar hook-length control protein FliK [Burkholderia sp. RF2-non_BP3]|uniref:flagellar hook-length control protein FliK n=1 Tax=Burkholderia sp. RF2-non_BP3 TaxID=1637844 RepID=UPI0009E92EA4|nr:flagellar hook-length control protein FliK [Burkholderia sp. RF2-non_BP3]